MIVSKKYEKLVFSFVMSFVMSFVITAINIGFVDGFILKGLEAWSKAFFVAFPAIVIVSPLVRTIVHNVVKK
jgi:hypothetical protein